MPEFPVITRGALIAALTSGRPYSEMAASLGIETGTELRWLCRMAGVHRYMRHGAVVLEIDPKPAPDGSAP